MHERNDIVTEENNHEFNVSYIRFLELLREGKRITGNLSGEGESLCYVGDIDPGRLVEMATEIEESFEKTYRMSEEIRYAGQDVFTAIGMLHNADREIEEVAHDCRKFGKYLLDKGSPEFVDSDEISRVRYLPRSGGYYLEGEGTTFVDVVKDLARFINPFN